VIAQVELSCMYCIIFLYTFLMHIPHIKNNKLVSSQLAVLHVPEVIYMPSGCNCPGHPVWPESRYGPEHIHIDRSYLITAVNSLSGIVQ